MNDVAEFKETIPVVMDLRNETLKPRHWDQLHDLVGYQIKGVEGFTMGNLISRGINKHADAINVISVEAVQEHVLEQMLAKVAKLWKNAEFEVMPYKEQKDVFILGVDEKIIADLDDSLVNLSTILGSRYVGPIREEVEEIQSKLVLLQETLDEWVTCQKNWMYLENIFSAPDIKKQLPVESKQFDQVDTSWKEILKMTNENPNCIRAGTHTGRRDLFMKHNAVLDQIQKSLEDYLEKKRGLFARFYFLSNDELLEILAKTKDPRAVQPYLRKCFDALNELEFGPTQGSVDIVAMKSPKGERVPLGRNLKAMGQVEEWMTSVENRMKVAIHKAMKAGLVNYAEIPRKEWVFEHPGQVVMTISQVMWANGTTDALSNLSSNAESIQQWLDQNRSQL